MANPTKRIVTQMNGWKKESMNELISPELKLSVEDEISTSGRDKVKALQTYFGMANPVFKSNPGDGDTAFVNLLEII